MPESQFEGLIPGATLHFQLAKLNRTQMTHLNGITEESLINKMFSEVWTGLRK